MVKLIRLGSQAGLSPAMNTAILGPMVDVPFHHYGPGLTPTYSFTVTEVLSLHNKGWVKKKLISQNLKWRFHGNRLSQGAEIYTVWSTHE